MQKTTSVLLGALVVAVTILVIWWAAPKRQAPAVPPALGSATPMSSASVTPVASAGIEALLGETVSPKGPAQTEGPGTRLLDGTVPPSLGDDAPKSLRLGVVLVQYRGAQRATAGTRSKSEALELAKTLAQLAQTDFKAAVEKGDSGSSSDVGRIPANILEPAPNYVLFTLPIGAVGGPVDTPTGYWIIKNVGK
jgi:hypothetical protein